MSEHESHSPFSIAPEEDLLYSLMADGSRRWIDPILVEGRYWKLRRIIAWFLMLIFLALPHIQFGGKPAIFLDIAHRQFSILGTTFHPTDNLLLLAFGASFLLTIFLLASLFGRLWCGYGCPQLVYMEFLFRPIETLIEGKIPARRRLNAGPWDRAKILKKGLKFSLFALLSLLFTSHFVSYFVSWELLWNGLLLDPQEHSTMLGVTLGISGLMFFDFAYFRDQMCTVACPWGRLQTVLYDQDTIIVGYDQRRGEPRGRKGEGLGDCVDCKRCITTCPTGMDIRRGLQMECVGCAQCIEACDEVMEKLKRPAGLISYTSLREMEGAEKRFWRPRVYIYMSLLVLVYGAFLFLSFGRADADAEFFRSGRTPYRILKTGQIANQIRARFTNHLHETQAFTIEFKSPEGGTLIVTQNPFSVQANKVAVMDIVTQLSQEAYHRGKAEGVFLLKSDKGFEMEKEFVLLGPYN